MCQIKPQFLLEAKIQSYKLYDKSFLSLISKNGWVADEVRCLRIQKYISRQINTYLHIRLIIMYDKLSCMISYIYI